MRSAVEAAGSEGGELLFSARLRNPIFRNPNRYLPVPLSLLASLNIHFSIEQRQMFFSKSRGRVFEIKKKNRLKGCATLCPGGFLRLASYWPVDKGHFGMWGRGESKRNVESKRLPLKEGAHGTRPCKKTCCFTSQLEPMRCFFASRNRKPDVGRLAPEMRTSFEFLIGEAILAGRIRGVESR